MTTHLRQQQFRPRVADNHNVAIPPVARVFLAVELVLVAGYFVMPPSALRAGTTVDVRMASQPATV